VSVTSAAERQDTNSSSSTGGPRQLIGRWLPLAGRWVLLVVLIGAWQLLGENQQTATQVSRPTLVARRIWSMLQDGSLWSNLRPTIEETLGGLAIGLVVGIALGVLMARVHSVGTLLDPYIVGINGLPRVALGPFFIVWFGIGMSSKMLLGASIVFVVVLFNAREGTASMDRDLYDALRSMRAGRLTMFRHLVLPSLMPWLLASLKIGIGLALTGAVVGELVGASAGLGWYITNSLNQVDVAGAMAALLVMALMAMVMYYIVLALESWLLRWRKSNA
jgi:NitT/TauT family transport system permease protein